MNFKNKDPFINLLNSFDIHVGLGVVLFHDMYDKTVYFEYDFNNSYIEMILHENNKILRYFNPLLEYLKFELKVHPSGEIELLDLPNYMKNDPSNNVVNGLNMVRGIIHRNEEKLRLVSICLMKGYNQ